MMFLFTVGNLKSFNSRSHKKLICETLYKFVLMSSELNSYKFELNASVEVPGLILAPDPNYSFTFSNKKNCLENKNKGLESKTVNWTCLPAQIGAPALKRHSPKLGTYILLW